MSKRKLFLNGFLIIIAGLGILAGVILTKQIQNIKEKAFSGYSSNIGTPQNVSSPLTFAEPTDVPQNDSLISDSSSQGLFYKFAKRYQNTKPEIQKISIPDINMNGAVFYVYSTSNDTTYVFSRFENLPPLKDKVLQLWLRSDFQRQYFHLSATQFILENNTPIAYSVYVGRGDIKTEGNSIVWSFDSVDNNTQNPESTILTVNF